MPILVGIQYSGNYTLFYKYKENLVIKILADIMPTKISLVTFVILERQQVPRL